MLLCHQGTHIDIYIYTYTSISIYMSMSCAPKTSSYVHIRVAKGDTNLFLLLIEDKKV